MGKSARLPGTNDDTQDQIVCHVDMDCFYAACERLREPALEGEPLVVGMGFEPGDTGGAVATASYEAREFGVESAMAISKALELLPRKIDVAGTDHPVSEAGFYRPVDLEYYESISREVKEILRDRADTVREVSIDEAYLDVTSRTDWKSIADYAQSIKDEIDERVGVTASIGVAPSMSAAKIASDHDKPDGLVVVEPGEVASFLAPLPVDAVHGIGPVTAEELREMGIETAGDLADADPAVLEDRFGERGRQVYRYARGEDEREVTPREKPKSFSRESAISDPSIDAAEQRDRIRSLAEAVAARADSRDVLFQTIGIKVVKPPFDVNTRERSLPGPVDDSELVKEVALDLFGEFEGKQIRKLGVRVSKLSFTDEAQPSLDSWSDREPTTETDSETADSPQLGQQSLTDFE